jgi:hypothetical protein
MNSDFGCDVVRTLSPDSVSETIQASIYELHQQDWAAYLRVVSGIMTILSAELKAFRALQPATALDWNSLSLTPVALGSRHVPQEDREE